MANESSNDVNVWFDNLTVTHLGPKLVQATDYYPFGSVASQWTEEDYRFGYQGQFAEDDTEETGLNYFMLRDYDPTIGRWLATDPYKQYWSPYTGMGNMPHLGADPDGGWNIGTSIAITLGASYLGGVIHSGKLNPFKWDEDDFNYGVVPGFATGAIIGYIGYNQDWQFKDLIEKIGLKAPNSPDGEIISPPSSMPEGSILFDDVLYEYIEEDIHPVGIDPDLSKLDDELIKMAQSIGEARAGDAWNDVISEEFWEENLRRKPGPALGYFYQGEFGGAEFGVFSDPSVSFGVPLFYAREARITHLVLHTLI